MEKFTLYLSVMALEEITKTIEIYMVKEGLTNYPITRIEINKGLPKNDYGQTVEVWYDSSKEVEFQNKNLENKALMDA